jgi:hypothetical protein
MEQLAIRSFLDNGHEFHLYCYEPIANVPPGTTVKCGTEVLPASEVFVYRRGAGKGSPSAFSNFFRYKMLLEKGGWWADLDAVCLRPLAFDDEHVACREREPNNTLHLNCGLIKAPAGSRLMEYCWEYCRRANKRKLRWGQAGPQLFARAVEQVGQRMRVLESEAFYPIDYWQIPRLVTDTQMPAGAYSIHLWNSQWKKHGMNPDAQYPDDCIYEQLERRFAVPTVALPTSSVARSLSVATRRSLWQMITGRFRRDSRQEAA